MGGAGSIGVNISTVNTPGYAGGGEAPLDLPATESWVQRQIVAAYPLYSADGSVTITSNGASINVIAHVGTAAGTVAAGNDSRIVGALQAANNLSDLTNPGSARSALGLGSAALVASTSFDTAGAAAAAQSAAESYTNTQLGAYMHLPVLANVQKVYVSLGASASDSNDGLSASSAKATIAGAKAALGSSPGIIQLLYGTFSIAAADAHGNGLTFDQPGSALVGLGEGMSVINVTVPVTWAVKHFASQCKSSDYSVVFAAGSSGSTYGVGVSTTAGGSVERQTFERLNVTVSSGTLTACYAKGPDNPGVSSTDISLDEWDQCIFTGGGSTYGFLFGNGTPGNSLLSTARGCGGNGTHYGVGLAGCGVTWTGGGFSNITVSDINITAVCNDAVTFLGVRGEGGCQVLNVGYIGSSLASVSLIDYCAFSYTPPDTKTILTYNLFAPLVIQGGCFTTAGSTLFAVNTSGGANAIPVTWDSVTTDCANPYPAASNYVQRQIRNATYFDGTRTAPLPAFANVTDGVGDPLGLGFPATHISGGWNANLPVYAANVAVYERVIGSGSIGHIQLRVGTSSGNVSVGAYKGTNSGATRQPGASYAVSGSIPCPAAGQAAIAIGSTVTPITGDYLAVAADNTTATFSCGSSGSVVTSMNVAGGALYTQGSAFPLPSTATPGSGALGLDIHMIGVA